jgi:phosphatidate cytidylyltransferase
MLKQRVLTAIVLVPLALLLIFFATPQVFRAVVSLILLVSSLEYGRLSGLGRIGTVALIVVQAVIFLLLFNNWAGARELMLPILTAACLTWCLMLLRLVTFQPDRPPPFGYSILGFACSVASMTFAWVAFAMIRDLPFGEYWIICLLFIVWAADIGGYFSGRHFGGRKLAPRISPSKTWAGLWGGFVLSIAVAIAFALALPRLESGVISLALLAAVTMLASVGGDLFISIQKRTMGLKDTGALLPGHGGVLDRFDSLLAAAPFFALGLLLTSR